VSWDRGFGLTPAVAWNNANNDSAYFAGTAGTVTLGGDITVSNLTIYTANNYFIGSAAEDNTLNFVNAGRITVDGSAGSGDSTIRSGITGSPLLTFRGRANTAAVFSLLPPANVTMTLGTLSVVNTYASNKNLILGGESTNVVNKITWTVTANQLFLQKKGTGTWTIESNMTLNAGKIFVEDGMLIMAGAANTNSHSINIGRTSGNVSTGKGKFMNGGTFTIMDTREHFIVYTGATLAPGVGGIGTITIGWTGTNDDTAKLNMNTGSIYEWEVGPNNTTDTVRIRKLTAKAATLLTGNITLKVLDAGGKPKLADQLPVFTYDTGVTRTLGTITIDTSALLGGWTGTPTLVDNGTGTIYLTGLQSPVAGTLIQLK
jgi:fibronectin-binding autotransporter adhesin